MKADRKQKPRGIKHKIREEKKRQERIGLIITVTILIILISLSGFLIHSINFTPTKPRNTLLTKA